MKNSMIILQLKKDVEALELKLFEANASRISNAHFCIPQIKKLGKNHQLGSKVILQMQSLGGKFKVNAFSISDGLSQKTIDALIEDLERTYQHDSCYAPNAYKQVPDFT